MDQCETIAPSPWTWLTDVVESAGGQSLWEVRRKQETGEEGKKEVITVTGQGSAGTAVSSNTQEDLQQETLLSSGGFKRHSVQAFYKDVNMAVFCPFTHLHIQDKVCGSTRAPTQDPIEYICVWGSVWL